MKRFFHNEQDEFLNRLVLMGQKAVEVTRLACRAIEEMDPEIAAQVIAADDAIDELEVEIDKEAIRYITLRAPVASDLRLFMIGTRVSHDLERVGDEACSMAKRVIRLSRSGVPKVELEIPQMISLVMEMLTDAVSAFLEGDMESAEGIVKRDRLVDEYHHRVHKTVTRFITNNPNEAPGCLEMVFIAKSLERVGDHASNLAEEVVFMVSGHDQLRHSPAIKAYKTKDREF